jgi:hypothetical protein
MRCVDGRNSGLIMRAGGFWGIQPTILCRCGLRRRATSRKINYINIGARCYFIGIVIGIIE